MINEEIVETSEVEQVNEAINSKVNETVAAVQAAPSTPRQELEAEIQSFRQQFAQAKLTHQEYLEGAEVQKTLMTECSVLIRYAESKLEKLPKD